MFLYVATLCWFRLNFLFPFSHNGVLMLRLGSGTNTTLLGFDKHHGLASNTYLVATLMDGDGPDIP